MLELGTRLFGFVSGTYERRKLIEHNFIIHPAHEEGTPGRHEEQPNYHRDFRTNLDRAVSPLVSYAEAQNELTAILRGPGDRPYYPDENELFINACHCLARLHRYNIWATGPDGPRCNARHALLSAYQGYQQDGGYHSVTGWQNLGGNYDFTGTLQSINQDLERKSLERIRKGLASGAGAGIDLYHRAALQAGYIAGYAAANDRALFDMTAPLFHSLHTMSNFRNGYNYYAYLDNAIFDINNTITSMNNIWNSNYQGMLANQFEILRAFHHIQTSPELRGFLQPNLRTIPSP